MHGTAFLLWGGAREKNWYSNGISATTVFLGINKTWTKYKALFLYSKWMIFLAKKISIFSVSSFAHMSLLSCECPVVLNFSLGQGRAGVWFAGRGSLFLRWSGSPSLPNTFPWNIPSSVSFYLNTIIVVIIWRGYNLILPLDWKGVLQLSLPIRQSDHTDKEW